MVKADPIAKVGKVAFVDIACQPRHDYPPLIRRSSFLAQMFRFETVIMVERASERIKFIISANTRGWLSQFRREKQQEGTREKGKATRKSNDQALEAPFKIIIMRLLRGAKRTFDRVLI